VRNSKAPRYLLLTGVPHGRQHHRRELDRETVRLCGVRCPHMNEITLEDTLAALRHNRYVIGSPRHPRARSQAIECSRSGGPVVTPSYLAHSRDRADSRRRQVRDAETTLPRTGGGGREPGGPTAVHVAVLQTERAWRRISSVGTVLPNERVDMRGEISRRVQSISSGRRRVHGEPAAQDRRLRLRARRARAIELTIAQKEADRLQGCTTRRSRASELDNAMHLAWQRRSSN
jgi:hypothetical protein